MFFRFSYSLFLSCAAAASLWADTELYISRHAAKIVPSRIVTIPSPDAGELKIHTFGSERLTEGTLLAVLNEEVLAMEEREAELSLQQQRIDRDRSILRLQKQKEELQFLKSLPQDRRAFAETRMKTQVDMQLLDSLDEEIALINEKFRLFEERSLQSLRKKRKSNTLTMPFDGRIQYHISLPAQEGGIVSVLPSAPIATIIDDSAYYIVLPATSPTWARLEHNRLSIKIDLGRGESLKANWHHMKVDKADRGEALFYYFLVPPEDNEKAFSLIGSNIITELFYESDESWQYVKKSDLAMEAGTRFIETWEKLVEVLRPGYDIVFIGETHLCLRKKDECTVIPSSVPAS